MNLLRSASTVSLLTLVSRITGLAREVLVASTFGAGAVADAFNVAFRIPNLLRRLFAEGAFSQAFVPLLARSRATQGDEKTAEMVDAVASVLFLAVVLTSALGVMLAPVLVWVMASGLKEMDLATGLTRWMFPYIACMAVVALSAGILNTWKRFAVPAATPILLNLSAIVAAVWCVPWFESRGWPGIYAMAAGVMLGGVLQVAVQWPALKRIGMLPRLAWRPAQWRLAWQHPGVGQVMRQMAPALLGVSVAQISLLINTQIASHVAVGAVSWLTYADRLMEFPTALLGVALGVILVPQLSAAQAQNDTLRYSDLLDWGLRLVLLLALPCALALLLIPDGLVAVLYHRGQFGANDIAQTSRALIGYGMGLLALIAIKILAPGFFARQDMRTPVRIAVFVLILTQCLNAVLVPWLGHAGLALAIGLGAWVNALWLLWGLLRQGAYRPSAGWMGFGLRVLMANAVMAGVLWGINRSLDWSALGQSEWLRMGWMALTIASAMAVYAACLWAAGLRPRQFFRRG